MRSRQYNFITVLVFGVFCFFYLLKLKAAPQLYITDDVPPPFSPASSSRTDDDEEVYSQQEPQPAPVGAHPIWHLVKSAERELEVTTSRQSKTLQQAVAEYRRRYGIPPPPNFDKWYEFARHNDVQLIDEFDTIHELMTPFWGLRPMTTRKRAWEALGYANGLLGVQIRDRKVRHIEGGGDWQRAAVEGMLEKFLDYLPDMDLCFNIHDEPRVVVPHGDMARLVEQAKTVNMPAANAEETPRNSFSEHVEGLSDGGYFEEVKTTRFNSFPHQATWTHSRLSCPPDSPSRALEDEDRVDDLGTYALGDLGFIYNSTAMSDICYTPSMSRSYGFFDRSNQFSVVHDLFPVFSSSKLSSFSDILFPAPWYWYEKVPYNDTTDPEWSKKTDQLYWRGSTTGGYSRYGGWRRQHRQRFVQKINAPDQVNILTNTGDDTDQKWEVQTVARNEHKNLMDVHFSHIGQCDRGDCAAQREFFNISAFATQQEAWQAKFILDMDGNAFSGRFHAFLRSRSLVYKLAVAREWHLEWLRPWAHYIPLSIQGNEWLEAVRYFGEGAVGKKEAERLAMQSREWANKVLRNKDLEVWFFRLLLEYGRVIDDDRDIIGFSLPS